MVQTVSVLESYEQARRPWIITNNHLFVASEDAPATAFGNERIGIKDKGLVADLEYEHVTKRKHLVQGKVVQRPPRTFADSVSARYRERISVFEDAARREFATAQTNKPDNTSHLERLLSSFTRADAYISTNGELYALTKSKTGGFRFRDDHYTTQHLGKTTKLRARHEKKMREVALGLQSTGLREQSSLSLNKSSTRDLFTAKLRIEPFVLHTPLGMYEMDGCTLRFDYLQKGLQGTIVNKPVVTNPIPYTHPFVFTTPGSKRDICFNSNDRWTNNGIHFGEPFPTIQAIDKISFVAAESARMLRGPYTKNTRPAQHPSTMKERRITHQEQIRKGLLAYGNK